MSLEYLSKYLKKDKPHAKKRKRGNTGHIVDDNLTGWTDEIVHDLQDNPTIVEHQMSRSAGFRPAYTETSPENSASLRAANSPLPTSDQNTTVQEGPRLSSGVRAGLQTKQQVAADLDARKAAQLREFSESKKASHDRELETVYRDATGRRIDITLAKQEKAREIKRKEELKEKERLLSQGLVQQQQKEQRRSDLDRVRTEGFSRYAGHAETETALKQKDRWNDPAAGFLTTKEGPSSSGTFSSRPSYKGGFAPNRFSIKPGYRWDGVDRGNGFEARRFNEIAKQNARRATYDTWAREDM